MGPGCPPPMKSPGSGGGVSSAVGHAAFWPGAGRSASSVLMPSPAFHLIVGRCWGLRWGLRAALHRAHGLRWPAPGSEPAQRSSDQSTGPHEGPSGRPVALVADESELALRTRWCRLRRSARLFRGPGTESLVPELRQSRPAQAQRCPGASSLITPSPHPPAGQALTTLWPLRWPIAILRGFAFSATGIRSRSTPPS